jgi:hypothetical protein
VPVGTFDGDAVDLGHQPVLGQAGLDHLEHRLIDALHDAPGALHELDLVVALHRALPVDEPVASTKRALGSAA